MKKILSIILTILMCFEMVGCAWIENWLGQENDDMKTASNIFLTDKILPTPSETLKVYKPSPSEVGVALTVARIFQGVINKEQPRIYIEDNGAGVGAIRDSILETYGEITFVDAKMDDVKAHQKYSIFWTLWEEYSSQIENVYIFDDGDGLSHSTNVAAMLAGRNNGVAITRELYVALYSEGKLKGKNVVDVCEEYGFSIANGGNFGINEWIRDNMVEGSNENMIFLINPDSRDSDSDNRNAIYDMAVAVDGLIYCIDPDFDSYIKIQKGILDQFGDNALVIGWPGINMEGAYLSSVSSCDKNVVCADWSPANYSVVTGFDTYLPQECTTVVTEDQQVIGNKVYIAFTVSDGDAWHYDNREFLKYWNSSVRGNFPITWTIPSINAKVNPNWMEYIYDTKSDLDEFIQGPCGIGYVHPSRMSDEAFTDYCEKTKVAFEKTKINMVNYWDSSVSYYVEGNERLEEYVRIVQPEAVFLGHCNVSNDYFMIGDTVCIKEMGIGNVRGTQTAQEMLNNIDNMIAASEDGKPIFIAMNVEAWGQGVSTIAELHSILLEREDAGRYEFVSSADLVGKIRDYEKNGVDGVFDSNSMSISKFEILPGTVAEEAFIFEDNGSAINTNKEHLRFADKNASWTYKFDMEKPLSFCYVTFDIANQYKVSVSLDGENWIEVLVYSGVTYDHEICSIDIIKILGENVDTFYVKFEDAVTTNGMGCGLNAMKIYYY